MCTTQHTEACQANGGLNGWALVREPGDDHGDRPLGQAVEDAQ